MSLSADTAAGAAVTCPAAGWVAGAAGAAGAAAAGAAAGASAATAREDHPPSPAAITAASRTDAFEAVFFVTDGALRTRPSVARVARVVLFLLPMLIVTPFRLRVLANPVLNDSLPLPLLCVLIPDGPPPHPRPPSAS